MHSRYCQAGLFALSAAETVFLPLVLEAFMAPMMLVNRRRLPARPNAFSRLRRIAPWRRTRASGDQIAQAVPEHGEHKGRGAQDAPAGERRVG